MPWTFGIRCFKSIQVKLSFAMKQVESETYILVYIAKKKYGLRNMVLPEMSIYLSKQVERVKK